MQLMRIKQSCGAAAAVMGMLLADAAWAGTTGYIAYAPLSKAAAVPTLSGWMLALMGLLVAVIAFRVMRAKNIGGRVASVVSAGIMALGAAAGNELISESKAALASFIALSSVPGGQVALVIGENEYRNTSGVTQQITDISIESTLSAVPTDGQPECEIGLTIANGSSCYLNLANNNS